MRLRRRAERRCPGAARQRGAIGIFGAMTLLLALVFAALAVDAGRLWMEKRGLQRTADIAAIEAARFAGCGGTYADAQEAAEAAAARNGFVMSEPSAPVDVELGGVTTGADGVRLFAPGGSGAVRVTLGQAVRKSLLVGGLFGETVALGASAVATGAPPTAAFGAGSSLATLDTSDSTLLNGLFGGLLGGSASLSLLSYQGIANTQVNLLQMLQASGTVGSVEQLLDADMSVGDALGLMASAASQSGTADVDAVAGMNQLVSLAHASSLDVRLADVLAVASPSSEGAAQATMNLLDLVNATLMVANGDHAVTLPLTITGVGAVRLTIIEPPQIAVGNPGQASGGNWCAEARTAQLSLSVDLVPQVLGPLNGVADVALNLNVGQGSAHLNSMDVGATSTVEIGAEPGILAVALTNTAGTGEATVASGVLGVRLDLNLADPSAAPLDFNVPLPVADSLPMQQTTSASVGSSLGSALNNPNLIKVDVLGISLLGNLLKPVVATILAPVLSSIGSAVFDPLLKLLGIQVGALSVELMDIRHAQSKLVI